MSDFKPWGVSVGEAVTIAAAGGSPYRFVAHKFGRNTTAAAGDAVWETGGAYPYLTYSAASAMRVKAGGNAADDSAGAGARTVTIQGLDENFEIATETVTLAGISASSATTTTFSRVLRVFVATAGANRVNTGAIVIENSGGTADYATITAGKSQSQIGFLTVPAGYQAWLTHVTFSTDSASATATIDLEAWSRSSADTVAAPFPAARLFDNLPALSRENGAMEIDYEEPIRFDEKTDIWFEATPSTGTPVVAVQFTILFERKS